MATAKKATAKKVAPAIKLKKKIILQKGVISPEERSKVLLFVDKKGDLIAMKPNRKGGKKGRLVRKKCD